MRTAAATLARAPAMPRSRSAHKPPRSAPPVIVNAATTPAEPDRYPVAIFGKLPAGFTLKQQNVRMLDFWHKKALAAGVLARAKKVDPNPEYDALFNCKWAIIDAAFDAKINNASEAAVLMQMVVRQSADCNDMDSVLDLEKLKAITLALVKVTAPLQPAKHVGALRRGRKLTRAGLLHRYQCFLIQELETLSWNLYGSRDYALQYRFVDHAVDQRCNGSYGKGSKRRSYPFFDESKLTARARSVLKSLRIDTVRNDDVPARKSSKRGTR